MPDPAASRLATDPPLPPEIYAAAMGRDPDAAAAPTTSASPYETLINLPYPLKGATASNGTLIVTELLTQLGDIAAAATAHNARLVIVYADVVAFSSNVTFDLANGALVIVARRIENAAGARIIMGTAQPGAVHLFAQSWRAPLQADLGSIIDITPRSNNLGRCARIIAGAPQVVDLARLDLPVKGEAPAAYRMALAILVFAAGWMDDHADAARDAFAFVSALSVDANGPLAPLNVLATALGQELAKVGKSQPLYVPSFTDEHYRDKIVAYLGILSAAESNLADFLGTKVTADAFIAQAQAAGASDDNHLTLAQDRLEIASSNFRQTFEALTRINRTYLECKKDSETRLDKFNEALNEYQQRQEEKAFWDIFTSVCTLMAGVATGVEALTTAPEEVATAEKQAGALTEAAKTLEKNSSHMKQLAEKVKTIGKGAEALGSMIEASRSIYEGSLSSQWASSIMPPLYVAASDATTLTDHASSGAFVFPEILPGLFDASWDEYLADFTATIAPYDAMATGNTNEDREFHKALEDYKATVTKMVANGKAASAAQLAAILDGQKLAMASVMVISARNELRMQQTVLAQNVNADRSAAQLADIARARILRLRLEICLLQREYRAAYRYYAGRKAKRALPVLASAAEFKSILPRFFDDAENALAAHSDKKSFAPISLTIKLADNDPYRAVLADLIRTKTAMLAITPDVQPFSPFGMIRISDIRARLDGVQIINSAEQENVSIVLKMQPGAVFSDQIDDKGMLKRFRGAAPTLTYNYQIGAGDINPDDPADANDNCPQFKPAAATAWTISIIDKGNNIDMSKVTALRLFFYGTHNLAATGN